MINPQLHDFLEVWNEKWATLPPGSGPAVRRAHFEDIAREMRLPDPAGVDANAEHLVASPAGPVRVRIFRYASDEVQPALIYMHGGAWMQGSPETHWDITARIAAWNRQTVISVDYAKAPERPFPQAFQQCVAVAQWAHASAADLRIDPRRIAIGGDSAGGNLAAAVALELRGTDVPLCGQLLIYPACDFRQDRPSMIENAEGPLIFTRDMPRVNATYCPNPEDLTNPRAAPLHAASHAGLPPAFVAVAEHDPLRDSGLVYADALEASGVTVTRDMGMGLIHGYLRAMEFCDDSRAKLKAMAGWLASIFERSPA
ncbi:alpha/beta hydrolase fold domain-containing protein [Rhodobacterales bacterium HKCCE3408]|nr:alpha/beta hydrolase fold domain-containing protein [Rhodobacterales bacterium HKCCE3408]